MIWVRLKFQEPVLTPLWRERQFFLVWLEEAWMMLGIFSKGQGEVADTCRFQIRGLDMLAWGLLDQVLNPSQRLATGRPLQYESLLHLKFDED